MKHDTPYSVDCDTKSGRMTLISLSTTASIPSCERAAIRPTKEQFVLVYGERGPRMTWDERAKAVVSAKQFQGALAAKQSGR
jgi:hypothetical protein